MNTTELRDIVRRGERFAPDTDDLARTVTAVHRRRSRRRRALQVAAVAVAVGVIAATTVTLASRPAQPAGPAPVVSATTIGDATAPAEATAPPTAGSGSPTGPGTAATTGGATVTAAQLAAYRWSELPAAPIAGRIGAATAWTGTEMLIWGGQNSKGDKDFGDGAAYNPATGQWRTLSASPLNARVPAAWVWTGSDLFIWGGDKGQRDGALYDPATDSWRSVPAPPPTPAATGPTTGPLQATAVWSGRDVLLLVWRSGGPSVAAFTYTQGGAGWTERGAITPRASAQIGQVAAAFVDGAAYSWVAWSSILSQTASESSIQDSISGYALDGTTWHEVDQRPALHAVGPVVVAGTQVIMGAAQAYQGFHSGPYQIVPGRRIDPATGRSTALPSPTGGAAVSSYQIAWTGGALLGYGSDVYTQDPDGTAHLPGAATAWDPTADRWSALAGSPMAFDRSVTGVWTGSELLVWGLMYPPDQANIGRPSDRAVGLRFAPPPG